jgi:nucleotide sugar dehydrogenase
MKICIVGLGYVGLPSALAFDDVGYDVVGADIDEEKVNELKAGKSPIPEIIEEADIQKSNVSYTTDTKQAVADSDAVLITVPTPVTPDKKPDLRAVKGAAEAVAEGMVKGKLVVLESTVYPGVTEEIVQPIIESKGLKAGDDFGLAYCPERYNPGDKEHTLESMPRIVGAINDEWLEKAAGMYSKITKEGVTKVSSIKVAEAAKVIENAQRDLNVGLMNELALIFDKIGIDTREVIDAAATKWNFHKYYPGPGVGGHCLPVDPYYLVEKSKELGYEPKIITAGREVNDYMATHVVELADRVVGGLDGKKVAVLGVSYKGNVGDARMSPAKRICAQLKDKGAEVYIYDPLVSEIDWGITISDYETVVNGADCIIIHSDHDEFKTLDLDQLANAMRTKAIVDSRGFVDEEQAKKKGFSLERI